MPPKKKSTYPFLQTRQEGDSSSDDEEKDSDVEEIIQDLDEPDIDKPPYSEDEEDEDEEGDDNPEGPSTSSKSKLKNKSTKVVTTGNYSPHEGPIPPADILNLLSTLKKKNKLDSCSVAMIKADQLHYAPIKAADGLIYSPQVVKKELLRYWKLAAMSEVVTVDDVISITNIFLRTGQALKLYPDYPKMESMANVFQFFSKCQRPKLKETNPHMTFSEIGRVCAKRWRALKTPEQKIYREKFADAQTAHEDDMIAFFQRHPNLKAAGRAYEARVRGLQAADIHTGPARAKKTRIVTGFDLFREAKAEKYADKYELEQNSSELTQKMRRKYEKLRDEVQAEYEDSAQEVNRKADPGNVTAQEWARKVTDAADEHHKHISAQAATQRKIKLEPTSHSSDEVDEQVKGKGELGKNHMDNSSTVDLDDSSAESAPVTMTTEEQEKAERKRKRKEKKENRKRIRLEEESVKQTLNEIGISDC